MDHKKRIIIALTGASGSIYARLLTQQLIKLECCEEIALITTRNGEQVADYEDQTAWFEDPHITRYDNNNLFSGPASGSASYDAMVVLPCSMGMVGRIATGVSNDLVSRAADVLLKERRTLIIVPRETPLNTIHLRNLTTLSEAGAIICLAAPSFYAHPKTIEEVCLTVVERILSLLNIQAPHYQWQG